MNKTISRRPVSMNAGKQVMSYLQRSSQVWITIKTKSGICHCHRPDLSTQFCRGTAVTVLLTLDDKIFLMEMGFWTQDQQTEGYLPELEYTLMSLKDI